MLDNSSNNYNVGWSLNVGIGTAITNLTKYTQAVDKATLATEKLQAISKKGVQSPYRGVGSAGQNVASGSKGGGANIIGGGGGGGSSQPSGGGGSSSGDKGGKGGNTTGSKGKPIGYAGKKNGFQSPLKNTPFYGLMGTMLAYSAISSQIEEAIGYSNIMTTAKSILEVADDDLSTFETRFANLSKEVRKIGVETKFTAQQVADATRYLAMAGMDMGTIQKSMRPISNLALIADEDLGLIADLATNIMTGYGLRGDAMAPVSDVLTATMTRSNVNIVELAESYKMSAGFMRAAGIDFTESAAAIGTLGNAGIKATMAGTALRSMAIRFAKPTRQAQQALDKLNVSFTRTVDVGGETVVKIKPLVEIFEDLKKKGATLEDMQKIFGTIGGNAAMNLMANVENIREITDANKYSRGTAGYVAEQKKNTTHGLWAQLTSTITEQFTRSFEILEPVIQDALKNITTKLSSKEFQDGIHQFSLSVFKLMDYVMGAFAWIGSNLSWIKPLVMGHFIGKNILNVLNGFSGFIGNLAGSNGANAAKNMGGIFGGFASGGAIGVGISALAMATGYLIDSYIEVNAIKEANASILNDTIQKSPAFIASFDNISSALQKATGKFIDLKKAKDDLEGKSGTDATGIDGNNSSSFFGAKVNGWNYRTNSPIITDVQLGRQEIATKLGTDKAIERSNAMWGDLAKLKTADDVTELLNKYTSKTYAELPTGKWGDITKATLQTASQYKYIPDDIEKDATKYADTKPYTDAFNENYKADMQAVEIYKNILGAKNAKEAVSQIAVINKQSADDMLDRLQRYFTYDEKTGLFSTREAPKGLSPADKTNFDNEQATAQNFITDIGGKGGVFDKMFKGGRVNASLKIFTEKTFETEPEQAKLDNISVRDLGLDGLNDTATGNSRGALSRSSNASPKQVIINIDNMLKIDNVNMDDESQRGKVKDLTDEIAQALLNITSDFSASFHG